MKQMDGSKLPPSPNIAFAAKLVNTNAGRLALDIITEYNQNHWGKYCHLSDKTENRSGQKRETQTNA